jgi:hypothetical protein
MQQVLVALCEGSWSFRPRFSGCRIAGNGMIGVQKYSGTPRLLKHQPFITVLSNP